MAETLAVQIRENLGTRHTRRLREAGSVPAILYGHGQANVCVAVPAEQLEYAVRHGSRLVQLSGALNERAFIRELQWDTFGLNVVHVDFSRISEHETVEVTVAIELRGEAPGVRSGGVIQHLIHEVELQVDVSEIPDKLHVDINHLELGGEIKVADLKLPTGAKILDVELDEVVVQCVEPVAEVEEAAGEALPGEPEVIGRKKEEEEEE